MHIVVCVKPAPPLSDMAFDPQTRRLRRSGTPLEPGSLDMVALGAAIALRDASGGTVTAIAMGPPEAEAVLRTTRLAGADRAVLLTDRAFAGADTLATARALADAVIGLGADLVLMGRHSLDAETGQVPPMVAELLGRPVVTGVCRLSAGEGGRTLQVEREASYGIASIRVPLPAVLSVAESLGDEAWPPEGQAEPDVPPAVERLAAASLAGPADRYGAAGSPTRVDGLRQVAPDRAGRVVDGDDGQAVRAAVAELLERPAHAAHALPAPDRAYGGAIWVWAQAGPHGPHPVSLELLGEAYRLTRRGGGSVSAVAFGPDAAGWRDALAAAGAERLYVHPARELRQFGSDLYADALCAALSAHAPAAILWPSTTEGRELAGLVAARLALGLTGDAVGLSPTADGRLVQDKPAFGGSIVAEVRSAAGMDAATLRAGVCAPLETPRAGGLEVVTLSGAPRGRGLEATGFAPDRRPSALLGARPVMIAVGAGVGEDGVAELAELAARDGYALGASRNVTDAGWLPKAYQVGLTGRAVAPDLYLAVGIAGWPEHLVGIRRAGRVLAVNPDREAPFVTGAADLAVVGGWREALPGVLAAVRHQMEKHP